VVARGRAAASPWLRPGCKGRGEEFEGEEKKVGGSRVLGEKTFYREERKLSLRSERKGEGTFA